MTEFGSVFEMDITNTMQVLLKCLQTIVSIEKNCVAKQIQQRRDAKKQNHQRKKL